MRAFIRDVVIPVAGIGLIYWQTLLPGERYGLIVAGMSMMGLPFVSYGARILSRNGQPPDDGKPHE